MSNEEIKQLSELWISYDSNETTRNEIQKLLDEKNFAELKKLMYPRIAFGTSGISYKKMIHIFPFFFFFSFFFFFFFSFSFLFSFSFSFSLSFFFFFSFPFSFNLLFLYLIFMFW